MACEEVEAGEATMFSLVTTLPRRHVFKYRFSIAQGEEQKARDEQQEREVIPTRHREIVVSTFDTFGEFFHCTIHNQNFSLSILYKRLFMKSHS